MYLLSTRIGTTRGSLYNRRLTLSGATAIQNIYFNIQRNRSLWSVILSHTHQKSTHKYAVKTYPAFAWAQSDTILDNIRNCSEIIPGYSLSGNFISLLLKMIPYLTVNM